MRLWYYYIHRVCRGPQFALYSGKRIDEYYTTLVAKVLCSLCIPASELMVVL